MKTFAAAMALFLAAGCSSGHAPDLVQFLRGAASLPVKDVEIHFAKIDSNRGLLAEKEVREAPRSAAVATGSEKEAFLDAIRNAKAGYGPGDHPVTLYSGLICCQIKGMDFYIFYAVLRDGNGEAVVFETGPANETNVNWMSPYDSKALVDFVRQNDPFLRSENK